MCLTAWVMGLKVQTLTTDLKVYTLTISKYTLSQLTQSTHYTLHTLTISKYTLSQLTSSQIMEYDLQ